MDVGSQKKRCVSLHKDQRFHVALTFYEANSTMAAHVHEQDQVSFLLAGEFREAVGTEEADLCAPAWGIKRSDIRHANRYGPNGALLLSINGDWLGASTNWRWRDGADVAATLSRLNPIARLQNELRSEHRADVVWDILAEALDDGGNVAYRAPSKWLHEVRERLVESPSAGSLGALASAVGMHPVHLSRAFKAAFGIPPSAYRARCRLALALSQLVQGETAASAATGAGFADQSHFARAARRELGITPKQIQGLLAA